MILYAVSSGKSEDYDVSAIFSTEEKALSYIDAHKERCHKIEYYILDDVAAKRRIWPWSQVKR